MELSTPVTDLPQISSQYTKKLSKLGIFTVKDLLTHFPTYHKDTTKISTVESIAGQGKFVIQAFPKSVKSIRLRNRLTLQSAILSDATGSIKATWFNQPYLEKALSPENEYLFVGNAKISKANKLEFYPESFEQVIEGKESVHIGRIAPQYSLTAGISIKWLRNRIKHLIDHLDDISDLGDELAKTQYSTKELNSSPVINYSLRRALHDMHFPETNEEMKPAREKLSLMELTNLQLLMIERRAGSKKYKAPQIKLNTQTVNKFISELAFKLTPDQLESVSQIIDDIQKDTPMNRLLQGDVGSGKTIVAVIAALAAQSSGWQTVILTPTTVLARQHYISFQNYLENYGVSVELVTGERKDAKSADVLIGTSAVLARKHNLIKNLGLVIADEQHRFGVHQREELLAPLELDMKYYPHCLDMTATPIPRTMALGLFGDLEISTINTKPQGRLPIKTYVVPEEKRSDSQEWVKQRLAAGEQVYWMCSLVTESDKLAAKSAEVTFESLRTVFTDSRIGLLHGQMKSADKEKVMQDFKEHNIDLLVTTSVIEVGIDVPNATVMIIEDADRFGLAQLHQIRGRVGRGDVQSWAFLFVSEEASDPAKARLEFFAHETDGLKIAEYDLQSRGPGEVYGARQSGIPNLKIADFSNVEHILLSKEVARELHQQGIRKIKLFEQEPH